MKVASGLALLLSKFAGSAQCVCARARYAILGAEEPFGKIRKLSRVRVADVANSMPDRVPYFMKRDPPRRAWTPEA
jgi:hypothetical protein